MKFLTNTLNFIGSGVTLANDNQKTIAGVVQVGSSLLNGEYATAGAETLKVVKTEAKDKVAKPFVSQVVFSIMTMLVTMVVKKALLNMFMPDNQHLVFLLSIFVNLLIDQLGLSMGAIMRSSFGYQIFLSDYIAELLLENGYRVASIDRRVITPAVLIVLYIANVCISTRSIVQAVITYYIRQLF